MWKDLQRSLRYCRVRIIYGAKYMEIFTIWGMFLLLRRGIKGSFDGADYAKMLQETMLPHVNDIKRHWVASWKGTQLKWQRNGWLAYNRIRVAGQSSDLNPIENLWDDFKRKIALKHPYNVSKLWETVKANWGFIPQ